jgi:hypothetical protein
MNKTMLRSFVILSLWSCLTTLPLVGAPVPTQVAGAKPSRTPLAIDISELSQSWAHSREEDQADGAAQVFRPVGSMKFPPSRFRMEYRFAQDGSCEALVLSPSDAHHFNACKWKLGPNDKTILQIIANGTVSSYRVVELSQKILRLAPQKPNRRK